MIIGISREKYKTQLHPQNKRLSLLWLLFLTGMLTFRTVSNSASLIRRAARKAGCKHYEHETIYKPFAKCTHYKRRQYKNILHFVISCRVTVKRIANPSATLDTAFCDDKPSKVSTSTYNARTVAWRTNFARNRTLCHVMNRQAPAVYLFQCQLRCV